MLKKILIGGALVATAAVSTAASAHDDPGAAVLIGLGVGLAAAAVSHAYAQPAPPPAVVYQPRPVYVAQPVAYGYAGRPEWREHEWREREWRRHEWREEGRDWR